MKLINPLKIILMFSIAILLPGFSHSANYPTSVGELVAKTKKSIMTVDMAKFKSLYDKHDVGLLIDVRDPNEFETGHIPGAINVSRGTLEFKIWPHVGGAEKPALGKQLTLYCASGGRCALAAKSLVDLGFTDVTAVDMKLEEWKNAGYPID